MDAELLLRWKLAVLDLQAATDPIQAEIDALTAKLREAAAPFQAQVDALEAEIKSAAVQEAASFKAHDVSVTYRKGYDRVTWDTKKLDGYAAAHPEVLPFRSVTVVAPSVSIKAAV